MYAVAAVCVAESGKSWWYDHHLQVKRYRSYVQTLHDIDMGKLSYHIYYKLLGTMHHTIT